MINKLRKLAKELKISDFDIVKARVFDDLCLALDKTKTSSYCTQDVMKRCNPYEIMPDAESIIVALFSYNQNRVGNVSKYAMGMDYHQVVKDKLLKLSKPITDAGYKAMAFADSWDLNERYLARMAGLGFIGKNHMFISPKYGSYVFIGALVTNCPLPENKAIKNGCKNCDKCVNACVGGALTKDGKFDENKCLSHITQKKGELSDFEEKLIFENKMLWGCDICQSVCPYNVDAPFTKIEEFLKEPIENLSLDENISNKEFKEKYGNRAFSWRGKNVILRNQKIINKMQK